MKTTLTIEESAKLIKLGVDPKLASKTIVTDEYNEQWENFQHPIFGLTDLLSILPKEIEYNGLTYGLNTWVESAVWNVEYCAEKGVYDFLIDSNIDAPELIDALNQLLIWCLEQGHCKCGKGGGR